jgi:hypothetical protein
MLRLYYFKKRLYYFKKRLYISRNVSTFQKYISASFDVTF